jgi:serine/threonine-protein kinase RsbW
MGPGDRRSGLAIEARVSLELGSRADAPMLVRATVAAIGEQLRLSRELVHDLKLAVSAACNNVVLHAYGGQPGPLIVTLEVSGEGIEVLVRDRGSGITHMTPSIEPSRHGLSVISALADRAEFRTIPGEGTYVRMIFGQRSDRSDGKVGRSGLADTGSVQPTSLQVSGDAVLTLSPVPLLGAVLRHLVNVLAARGHFSLDRIAEVGAVSQAAAAHAELAASGADICVGLLADEGRVDIAIAPLRAGASTELKAPASEPPDSPLARLADELEIAATNGDESLHLVLRDRP